MKNQTITTYQYYYDRVISAREGAEKRALDAAQDFAKCATLQSGVEFEVEDFGTAVHIDLEDWPDDLPFGDWFDQWAKKWDIRIEN